MATMNYLRRALLILLVLVPVGCGGETATEAPAAEERTTEEATIATTAVDSSLYYVALGDSLATGYGLTGYVDRYAGLLGTDTGTTVDVYNLGVNGLTSGQLRNGIESDRRVKE